MFLPIIIPIIPIEFWGNQTILNTIIKNEIPIIMKNESIIIGMNRFIISPYSTLYPIPQTVLTSEESIPATFNFSLRFLI